MRTRNGAPSRSGSSPESTSGHQNRRMYFPIGVPGPTRVIRSFSSGVNMSCFLLPRLNCDVDGPLVRLAADDFQRSVDVLETHHMGRDQFERIFLGFHRADGELDRFIGMAAHALQ